MSKVIGFLTLVVSLLLPTASPKSPPPDPLPITTPTLQPLATPNGCEDNPPPWPDRETAERCWVHYPPPFGDVIVRHCETGLSDFGDIICYGYWLIPDAVYPLLTPQPPTPTLQPTGYPAPYP